MIDPRQLLQHVIRPVLKDLGLWSEPAERLVLGTACQESQCGRYLRQLGTGPALGIFQMEEKTHDDIHKNYLSYKPALRAKLVCYPSDFLPDDKLAQEMIGNLYYATAMCRVHYYRVKDALPDYLSAQAQFWKKYYNTELGAGTPEEYMASWNRFVTPNVLVA